MATEHSGKSSYKKSMGRPFDDVVDRYRELVKATGFRYHADALSWIQAAAARAIADDRDIDERIALKNRQVIDLCGMLDKADAKIEELEEKLAASREVYNDLFSRYLAVLLATGNNGYDAALTWINGHRDNDSAKTPGVVIYGK